MTLRGPDRESTSYPRFVVLRRACHNVTSNFHFVYNPCCADSINVFQKNDGNVKEAWQTELRRRSSSRDEGFGQEEEHFTEIENAGIAVSIALLGSAVRSTSDSGGKEVYNGGLIEGTENIAEEAALLNVSIVKLGICGEKCYLCCLTINLVKAAIFGASDSVAKEPLQD
ncbi:hypothetical protein ACO22_04298 [Paracoccidioides brasiliensis]|uniref:Uncharacterized protein n=1 Tax=Paracoccidioides brasiliensis TaxID=121759 RepID=A0A1D2JDH8_PARBR|nr:hypothetical protein ACO22_04298 [Paracoccidioides brasiliensis]